MRSPRHQCLLAAVVVCTAAAAPSSVAVAADPVPSFSFLVTGNGFGFQVFDADQNAITQFLERPYRFMYPNPQNPDGEGIVRRNLAFDAYFGVRTPSESVWLNERSPSTVEYVDQTNVIRSVVDVGDIRTESFFFSPYGYEGNAMVMVLRVTNNGSSAASVDAFQIANFHMGSAPSPDSPQANGESIQYDTTDAIASETGPGGGTVMYAPIGGADRSSCAAGMWNAVASGQDITNDHSCTGDDQVNVFQHDLGSLDAGQSATWGVAILFDGDGNASMVESRWNSFVNGDSASALLQRTLDEWEAWRTPVPGGLSATEARIWRQSETVLRMGQTLEAYSESPKRKNHGMVLASLPPGGWHSGWVRDAVYAIVAYARTGHYQEAKWALNFFLNAEAGKYSSYLNDVDYRITTVRYFGNGEEEADYSGQPTRNIEIDGWGLFLWAARVYVDESGDVEWLGETTTHGDTVYEAMREGVAEAIAANLEPTGMAIADASIWEVHWGNREHFLYTTAAVARGLCDMAGMSRHIDELEDRDRYKQLSDNAVSAIEEHFVDQNGELAGSVQRLSRGFDYRDGAAVEALTWELIGTDTSIASSTMNGFSYLRTAAGGYKRVEGSSDPYDTDEWILIDLRAADAWRRVGNTARADELLDWVTSQANVNYDLIPELYNTSTSRGTIGAYTGSIPMVGYGAGAYQLTLLARNQSFEYRDCGTVNPDDRPDGGIVEIADAGPDDDGGNTNGVDGRTGFACACRFDRGPGAGGWLLIGFVALGLRIRRRRD